MKGRDFIMNGGNKLWKFEISLWTVEIFMMMSRYFIMSGCDFHDNRSRFYYKRLRFSWWQVEICYEWLKFSWWQVFQQSYGRKFCCYTLLWWVLIRTYCSLCEWVDRSFLFLDASLDVLELRYRKRGVWRRECRLENCGETFSSV